MFEHVLCPEHVLGGPGCPLLPLGLLLPSGSRLLHPRPLWGGLAGPFPSTPDSVPLPPPPWSTPLLSLSRQGFLASLCHSFSLQRLHPDTGSSPSWPLPPSSLFLPVPSCPSPKLRACVGASALSSLDPSPSPYSPPSLAGLPSCLCSLSSLSPVSPAWLLPKALTWSSVSVLHMAANVVLSKHRPGLTSTSHHHPPPTPRHL